MEKGTVVSAAGGDGEDVRGWIVVRRDRVDRITVRRECCFGLIDDWLLESVVSVFHGIDIRRNLGIVVVSHQFILFHRIITSGGVAYLDGGVHVDEAGCVIVDFFFFVRGGGGVCCHFGLVL